MLLLFKEMHGKNFKKIIIQIRVFKLSSYKIMFVADKNLIASFEIWKQQHYSMMQGLTQRMGFIYPNTLSTIELVVWSSLLLIGDYISSHPEADI